MPEPEHITDQEFLDQLVDRLKSSGHKLVFVDRGLIQFSKVAATFLGLFLLIALTFFGLDLKNAADELSATRSTIEAGKAELNTLLSEIKNIEGQVQARRNDITQQVAIYKERLIEAEDLARNGFSRSLISLTGVVADTVPRRDSNILRDFYRSNVEFAERRELPRLRIEFMRRLAVLEWFDGNRALARSLFDQAVKIALGRDEHRPPDERLKRVAAETLLRRGEFELSNYPEERQVALAKAKRLFNRALGLFETSNHAAGQAKALQRIAGTYRLEGNQREALEFFERARRLHLDLDTDEHDELFVVSALAELYRALGQNSEAADYYSESVSIAEGLNEYHSASEYALELARLQEPGPARLTYLCAATKYFNQAPQPKREERFGRKLERIQASFDPNAACSSREQ